MRKVVFKELERALLGFNQKYFRARHVVLIERACLGPISSTTKIKQKCFKQIAVPAEGLFCVSVLWGPVKIRQ